MRVLLIDRTLTNGYTLGLAAGLRENGVHTVVGGPAAFRWEGRDGIGAVTAVYARYGMRRRWVAKAADLPGAVARMAALLARFKPDVVHLQWASALDHVYARAARELIGAVVVFTVHNPRMRAQVRTEVDSWLQRTLPLADALVTHGPVLRGQLAAAQPALAGRIHTVEHGNFEHLIRRYPRDEARRQLGIGANEVLFAFVGQVRAAKGLETLLKAFALHRGAGHPGSLLVVGTATDQDYVSRVRAVARREGLEPEWMLSYDHMPQQALDLAVCAADQVVLPFDEASQSGTVVFGMTHGRCVVATAVGEIARTLEGRGLLVSPQSPDELAAAMKLAVEDPETCVRLGAEAREYALTALSRRNVAAQTIDAYEAAMRRLPRRQRETPPQR
jgi:glycosyltransferase involved in cell wall biosynthesis